MIAPGFEEAAHDSQGQGDQGRGIVVSDLHLFSRRSDGEQYFQKLEPELSASDALVLNGDTFDFRWSHHPTEIDSIEAALGWLEAIHERHPSLTIHFLLGNHDCLANFHREISTWSADRPNFQLIPDRLILGRNLFLHGDCTNRRMDGEALGRFRETWSRDRPRGRFASRTYAIADSLGISRRFHDWYFPEALTLRRLAHHLDHVMPGWVERVDHCYFGHTHRPFTGVRRGPVQFSNTGSGIQGMGFRPCSFTWKEASIDS